MLVGVSANTVDEMLSLIKASEECEVSALVLAPMFGEVRPEEQLKVVIQTSTLPVLLYNNPAIHNSTSLPLSIVKEFTSHPKVIGIKNSSGDWEYFLKLLDLRSTNFRIFQGRETLILPSLEGGSAGIVAGAGNIAPALLKQVLLHRDQETMERVLALKSEIKQIAIDSVLGYKHRLVKLGIIRSAAMFTDSL